MFWNIIQLLLSVGLIIGGLSGEMVLRGTNSSSALVVFGFLWLAYDIYCIVVYTRKKKNLADLPQLIADVQKGEILTEPCAITLSRDSSFVGALKSYEFFLNGASIGRLKNGASLSFTTTYKKNVINCPELPNNFMFEIQGSEPVRLHFKIRADDEGQNIRGVSGAERTDLLVDGMETRAEETVKKAERKKHGRIPVIITGVVWIIFIIICFILSYDEYTYKIKSPLALIILIMGTALVIIGCVMVILKQKKGLILALGGGIINILWSLVYKIFYWGMEGYERFHTDEFIPFVVLTMLPGMVLLPLLFYKKKFNKED